MKRQAVICDVKLVAIYQLARVLDAGIQPLITVIRNPEWPMSFRVFTCESDAHIAMLVIDAATGNELSHHLTHLSKTLWIGNYRGQLLSAAHSTALGPS